MAETTLFTSGTHLMILIAKMLLNPPNTLRLAWHGRAETTLFTSGTHLMFLIPKMLLNHPNPLRLAWHGTAETTLVNSGTHLMFLIPKTHPNPLRLSQCHSPVPQLVEVLYFPLSLGPGYTTYFPQELCSTWMDSNLYLQ